MQFETKMQTSPDSRLVSCTATTGSTGDIMVISWILEVISTKFVGPQKDSWLNKIEWQWHVKIHLTITLFEPIPPCGHFPPLVSTTSTTPVEKKTCQVVISTQISSYDADGPSNSEHGDMTCAKARSHSYNSNQKSNALTTCTTIRKILQNYEIHVQCLINPP